MARKVFYSFHHSRGDAWRAGVVRNYNMIPDEDEYAIWDSVEWEKLKLQGDIHVQRWIDEQLKNTSVTVVLIGSETYQRKWVNYEIRESWQRGNALIGIRIQGIKDMDQQTSVSGPNPFDLIKFEDGTTLSSVCPTYDWDLNDGRANMGRWVEDAYQARATATAKKLAAPDADSDIPSSYSASASQNASSGAAAQRTTPTAFTPRAPWCNAYADDGQG